MKPLEFPEQTYVLKANPNQMEIDGTPVGDLGVYTDGEQTISCWRMTWRERLSALFYGRVWLYVHFGINQPPVALSATKTVFMEAR